MKKAISASATILALLALAASAFIYLKSTRATAQQGQPIGYVDSDRIVQEYAPARDANASWDEYQQQQENAIRAKMREKYKTDDPSTLPRESQLEIQKMLDDADAQRKQQFNKINKEKWEPAKAKIQAAIESAAQQKGLIVVLEKKAVLAGGTDITDAVLSILNK